jgi:2-polyprenyl-6-methoxyphenol hydroxylase-like FAD-dependent oxidoreductase
MSEHNEFAIVGGGMAGLVLALGLKKHCNVHAVVYDGAPGFGDGIGGAIGMYPNGLRVIKDLDPALLETLRQQGYPYIDRRWYRHDGTLVAVAKEALLTPTKKDDDELSPMGIRRWKLQKALYNATVAAGIPVHFDKWVDTVEKLIMEDDPQHNNYKVTFGDKTSITAKYVFGADGVKSRVRNAVLGDALASEQEPEYTGVTCLMGATPIPRPVRGICFPSSVTTKCHMCTYPTGEDESIFQIYFPTPVENPDAWGALSGEEGQKEVSELADRLIKDGWDSQFIETLQKAHLDSLVRVGLRARDPVSTWVSGGMVLMGDAAHPPVPYIGQGAMMAIEDAGTCALLMKHYCVNDDDGSFSHDGFVKAMEVYQQLRIPRTGQVLGSSKTLGETQQKRADSWMYNLMREWSIKWQVLIHGTLPIMLPGATYDYKDGVQQVVGKEEAKKDNE